MQMSDEHVAQLKAIAEQLRAIINHNSAAAAPEPMEWVTEEDWMPGGKEEYALHHRFSLKHINRLLTAKYGPPPVVKLATGEDEGRRVLTKDVLTGKWFEGDARYLEPGDRYVELPKCCGEGEA